MATRKPLVVVNGGLAEIPAGDVLEGVPTSHAQLTGLTTDDHPQYHTDARGDLRYASLGHTHPLTDLQQSGAASGQILTWNGTAWAPANAATATPVAFQSAVMTATQSSSATALASVTQLSLPMVANGVYRIDCFVTFQSAATTTGLNVGLATPTGCRNMVEIVVPITSIAASTQLRTIYPNAAVANNSGNVLGTGVTATASNHTARISGLIRNGATAGNCQIQFATEVAASAITLQIGSELQLIRVA